MKRAISQLQSLLVVTEARAVFARQDHRYIEAEEAEITAKDYHEALSVLTEHETCKMKAAIARLGLSGEQDQGVRDALLCP